MFTDLNALVCSLTSKGVDDKLNELASKFGGPTVAIYAVGGIPIRLYNGEFEWAGNETFRIKSYIKDGLGASAALTYLNPNHKSYDELGQICLDKGHSWAYHWMTVSMVLVNFPLLVEMSFAHDTRFQLSWTLQKNPTGKVVGITGTIKNWLDFTKHYNDSSFDESTRNAMFECRSLLTKYIIPRTEIPSVSDDFIDSNVYDDLK